jgi:hypothetical protein
MRKLKLRLEMPDPEWFFWKDNDIYYAKKVSDGTTHSNVNASTLINYILELTPDV